jgi:hypothetical protein
MSRLAVYSTAPGVYTFCVVLWMWKGGLEWRRVKEGVSKQPSGTKFLQLRVIKQNEEKLQERFQLA